MGSATRILVAATATTALVTAAAYAIPSNHAATGVGLTFLAAVYLLVLRRDTSVIRAHGLSLGGLLETGPISMKRTAGEALIALAWASGVAALVFPLFWIGFAFWWNPQQAFSFTAPESYFDEILGQLIVIALPEEAFYRGYLQSSIDQLWSPKPGRPRLFISILGAQIGWSTPITSAIFAIGHFMTEPNPQRLAVFFPSLMFCWLRSRTGGVGAAILLHAMANLFSSTLGRSYGFIH